MKRLALLTLLVLGAAPAFAAPSPEWMAVTVAPPAGSSLSGVATLAAEATEGTAAVTFYVDGVPVGAEATSAPYKVEWNSALVAVGRHELTAAARDGAGHRAVSAPVSIVVANGKTETAQTGAEQPTTAEPAAGAAPAAPATPVEARAPQRFLSPSLADGVNDAAEFGADAEDVTVFDSSGRQVFHGSRGGAAAGRVVWNCRDGAGRIVESGVYVARIRKADNRLVHQSFAVVK